MDGLLTAVSTAKVRKPWQPLISETSPEQASTVAQTLFTSGDDVLKALKGQPNLETIGSILRYLATEADQKNGFNLVAPTPLAAQIVDTLVSTTVPDFWGTIKGSAANKKYLVRCLQNASGLGAILSRLRPLIADCRQKKPVEQTRDPSQHIRDLLGLLEQILKDDETTTQIWNDMRKHAPNAIQRKLMWKEYVSQVASGRVLSVVAQGEDALKERGETEKETWLADGSGYASWLGHNVATLMREHMEVEDSTPIIEFSGRVLSLGYTDRIVLGMLEVMLKEASVLPLEKYLPMLKIYEQRQYLNAIVSISAKHYLGLTVENKDSDTLKSTRSISGVASLVHSVIKTSDILKDHLVSLLTNANMPAINESLAIRRCIIAALAPDKDKLQTLMEKTLKLFGDSFFITHTPILQQEALAQTLALSCAYVHRSEPMFLTIMAKSTYHTAGMSNRIGASSARARFLGMAVGMAISKMVDKPDLQMNFDLEGTEANEAKWYQQLTQVDDKIGTIKDLQPENVEANLVTRDATKVSIPLRQKSKPTTTPAIIDNSGPRVVEILDESSDDDDDLVPYEKPDSDPEDETDDPTEIDRNKPTAPVYIRDLIAGLRDTENYDRHQLALSTAAPLIRRKANFGTEVSDHIEELATILVGLNDNLDIPEFDVQRQQALIAILLAKPPQMAQWFARTFFSGDFSLTQRITILTTLCLGARDLAGHKDSSTDDLVPGTPSFPSKELPPALHKIYAEQSQPSDPVGRITNKLSKGMLAPLAATAADKLTGPDILKVRTFSSRMEVQKKRQKPIPNALAQIVATDFFFPLTGRWWIHSQPSSPSSALFTDGKLLAPYLQTLALLLHASGPSTLSLPQMTRELWELLLSVRSLALQDKTVLSSLLFAFLMLLETNEDKERIATEQAKELLETQEWVRMVFEGLGGGSEEDDALRVRAAGVVVRCQEVVERYQRRMVGSMVDY